MEHYHDDNRSGKIYASPCARYDGFPALCLFLVCKGVYQEAREVFYSSNAFSFVEGFPSTPLWAKQFSVITDLDPLTIRCTPM